MRLCMMPVIIFFVSRLGITDLVNKIKMYSNLIKLFNFEIYVSVHTDLFFFSMLHAQNLFYIHILYTQKGVYSIFECKTNFEREAFRFSMSSLKVLSKYVIIFWNIT